MPHCNWNKEKASSYKTFPTFIRKLGFMNKRSFSLYKVSKILLRVMCHLELVVAEVEGLQLRVAEGVTGQGAQPEEEM